VQPLLPTWIEDLEALADRHPVDLLFVDDLLRAATSEIDRMSEADRREEQRQWEEEHRREDN
jgi:hypothetical protein